jgi:hypothetical protein
LSTAQGAVKDNHPCWQSFWECPEITFGCQKMQNPQKKGGIPQFKKKYIFIFQKSEFPVVNLCQRGFALLWLPSACCSACPQFS